MASARANSSFLSAAAPSPAVVAVPLGRPTRPSETDELPAGLAIDFLSDVNACQLLLVGQIARHVVIGRDVGEQRSAACVSPSTTLRTPPMIMSPENTVLFVPSEKVTVSIPQSSTSTGLAGGVRSAMALLGLHEQDLTFVTAGA